MKIKELKKKEHEKTLENLMKLLKQKDEQQIYEVEPEIVEWAKLHAKFFIDRYKERPDIHWTPKQWRNAYVGMVGHKCFEVILQQFEIPYVPNDPAIRDWWSRKYDFLVPPLGRIEVKAFDHHCKYALFKLSEWHGCNYAVVFRFCDPEPKNVNLEGWLTGAEVENLPIAEKGKMKISRYEDCRYTPFKKLNPASKFIKLLKKISVEG